MVFNLKIFIALICFLVLSLCSACSLIFEDSAPQGPVIIIREAQEPTIISYPNTNIQNQESGENKAKPPIEPEKVPAELVSVAEDDALQTLRRQRIPLRRNRHMLLKQQDLSANPLQN